MILKQIYVVRSREGLRASVRTSQAALRNSSKWKSDEHASCSLEKWGSKRIRIQHQAMKCFRHYPFPKTKNGIMPLISLASSWKFWCVDVNNTNSIYIPKRKNATNHRAAQKHNNKNSRKEYTNELQKGKTTSRDYSKLKNSLWVWW